MWKWATYTVDVLSIRKEKKKADHARCLFTVFVHILLGIKVVHRCLVVLRSAIHVESCDDGVECIVRSSIMSLGAERRGTTYQSQVR